MSEYRIGFWAYVLAIIAAVAIEYYLIIVESFVDFQNAFGIGGGFMIYMSVTIMTIVILKFVFYRIWFGRFGHTYLQSMAIALPTGFIWAMYSGHKLYEQLLNLDWQFTHDMVYTVLVTQIVVMAILLLGTQETGEATVEHKQILPDMDW